VNSLTKSLNAAKAQLVDAMMKHTGKLVSLEKQEEEEVNED
jgi:hypothetical protein